MLDTKHKQTNKQQTETCAQNKKKYASTLELILIVKQTEVMKDTEVYWVKNHKLQYIKIIATSIHLQDFVTIYLGV